MDVKMVNPFINATMNVLETMAFTKSEAGKPYIKKDNVAKGDVSGVIGFTGETNGTISVTFDELCILKIVSNMFGQARKELGEMGKLFHGAIPSVITGKNHKLESLTKGPRIAIPFKTDAGSFTIIVCLEKK
jgi:chemotaxis protein CheX